jgi:hypothetical protein
MWAAKSSIDADKGMWLFPCPANCGVNKEIEDWEGSISFHISLFPKKP